MNMNMVFAGMVLMVVVVVAVGDCCPCLLLRSAPPTLLRADKYVEKSTCQANTSSPTRMGRRCAKLDIGPRMGRSCANWKDKERQWAKKKEDGAILFCLSVMTCTRHDYVYVYSVYVA